MIPDDFACGNGEKHCEEASGTMPACTGTAGSRSHLSCGLPNHCDLLLQMTKGQNQRM